MKYEKAQNMLWLVIKYSNGLSVRVFLRNKNTLFDLFKNRQVYYRIIYELDKAGELTL